MKIIDLRSDTCSLPTEKMLDAMRNAQVGNSGYNEDPTVNRLEEIAAKKLGKEKAIFIPSGTIGNQAAIMSHTSKGDEIIAGAESHIYLNEVGGYAALGNVAVWLVPEDEGFLPADKVERVIRGNRLTDSRTSLICLENTHNRAGGKSFIEKAWRNVKLLGGVMRQAGYIAAPGIIALEEMIERLKEDQKNAKKLALGLYQYHEIHLELDKVETNIIKFGVKSNNGWNAK